MDDLDVRAHSAAVRAQEARDALAERRLVHSVAIWIAVLVPIGAVAFSLLILLATNLAGVPEGAPVLMGAGIGVLAGIFFGMWAGVVVSSGQIERTEQGG
jgi:hypothetical protein